jgi:hypothetical protein
VWPADRDEAISVSASGNCSSNLRFRLATRWRRYATAMKGVASAAPTPNHTLAVTTVTREPRTTPPASANRANSPGRTGRRERSRSVRKFPFSSIWSMIRPATPIVFSTSAECCSTAASRSTSCSPQGRSRMSASCSSRA